MTLDGLHHITMITGDARQNVAFYADLLGLRMVKKTVNFDSPDAYHLYFGDEPGTPGTLLTWFEFPGAAPARPGAGEIHTLELGVASEAALDFWADRLARTGTRTSAPAPRCASPTTTGSRSRWSSPTRANQPLRAVHPDIPAEHAITGLEGARAYAPTPTGAAPLLTDVLGFTPLGRRRIPARRRAPALPLGLRPGGRSRPSGRRHRPPHRLALADEDHLALAGARARRRPCTSRRCVDRDYFRSIYFREPRGILFEIATRVARLRRRRGSGAPRRGAAAARAARAPARAARAVLTPIEIPRRAQEPA